MPHNYEYLVDQSIEIIQAAAAEFGNDLWLRSSFGTESALMPSLLRASGVELQVVSIDTGFWFDETYAFQADSEKRFDFNTQMYRPEESVIASVQQAETWKHDLNAYHAQTKLEPMTRAVKGLRIAAAFAGVRRYQTENRSNMSIRGHGRDGEVVIRPILDWTEQAVNEYFEAEGLPRHPLFYEGYGSVGDWTTTIRGVGRNGRQLNGGECDLNVVPDDNIEERAAEKVAA